MCLLFFFFKQKTAYEMRISDWSSDVCSSDLPRRQRTDGKVVEGEGEKRKEGGMTNRGRNFMMPSFNAILLAGAAAMLPLGAPAHAAPEEAPTAEIVPPHDDSVLDVDSEAYDEEQQAKKQPELEEAIARIKQLFHHNHKPPTN